MRHFSLLLATALLALSLIALLSPGLVVQAQTNPTPVIIVLTPADSPTVSPPGAPPGTPPGAPTLTSNPSLPPDRFEPNDDASAATVIGWGTEADLNLVGDDVDTLTGFLKAGQILEATTTVYDGLDTMLSLSWAGQGVAENDDQSPTELGSSLTFNAPSDGWFTLTIRKVSHIDGSYNLTTSLVAPTATPTRQPTASPTLTPTPSPTPWPTATATSIPTMTPSPWPSPYPTLNTPTTVPIFAPPTFMPPQQTMAPVVSATLALTPTAPLSLTLHHIGRVTAAADTVVTNVRLLIYYDANNDRTPGPGEGVANVSVLAVDAQGQPLARVFTNALGEARFNLSEAAVARVVVPFVPGWSARVRVGESNNDVVLGLPAVRLPVFLPVADLSDEAGE